ncbi:MAG: hypothetical protein HY687_05150 [Chloroflexi bacterium]|nr:hypothetical protein [Chloroflexota bacterium]
MDQLLLRLMVSYLLIAVLLRINAKPMIVAGMGFLFLSALSKAFPLFSFLNTDWMALIAYYALVVAVVLETVILLEINIAPRLLIMTLYYRIKSIAQKIRPRYHRERGIIFTDWVQLFFKVDSVEELQSPPKNRKEHGS